MFKSLCGGAAALLLAAVAPAPTAPKPTAPAPSMAKSERVVLPKTVRPDRYDIRISPDAAKLAFHGEAKIALTVLKPTAAIELNAADIVFDKAALSGVAAPPKISLDPKTQTARFEFGRMLRPGRYTLSLAYEGKIFQQPSGFFALDYDTSGGKKRALFTQFENSDARRFAPSWDEPGIKSVFSLTVVAPADEMAVSNMPVAQTTQLGGGLQAVRFADTPKMSSYLLFLALGDFERIHRKVGKTDVGVVVRRGDTAKAAYDLEAAAELLGYYDDYFGTPYPLPKLDLIAGPGRSQFFCGMENWGAIFFFDTCLLTDPKLATEADRQDTFTVIAHELAHQWFGDLVTMAWWDDLWLNEGFASWMERKATDHFHPEWNTWLQALGGEKAAMQMDAAPGTHPIITPIPDVFAAGTAFDEITYDKGQAVIRMLESYVGPEVFRAGVRNYIAHHAYGNTVTDDFWRELDKVSSRSVTPVAHDFTLQAGVPLITATAAPGGVELTQGRFFSEAPQSGATRWRTPVRVAAVGGGPDWAALVSAGAAKTAPLPPDAIPIVNAGQTAYFRTTYGPTLWAGVSAAFMRLQPADQLGLLDDSRAIGESPEGRFSDYLALIRNVGPTADPLVLRTLAEQLDMIDGYYRDQPGRMAFRAFARARLAPVLARVGWNKRPGEPDNVAVLRASVLTTLGDLGDPQVVAEARRRFQAWLAHPDSLTGSARRTVLTIMAANADQAIWNALHARARSEADVSEKTRLYDDLGLTEDRALARQALELALSGEPSATDVPEIVAQVGTVLPDMAYDFAIAHRAQLEALLEPDSRVDFFTRLASGSREAAMLEKLEVLARTVPPSTRGEVTKAEAQIRRRRAIVETKLPEADRWIAAHPG